MANLQERLQILRLDEINHDDHHPERVGRLAASRIIVLEGKSTSGVMTEIVKRRGAVSQALKELLGHQGPDDDLGRGSKLVRLTPSGNGGEGAPTPIDSDPNARYEDEVLAAA